MYTSDLRCRKQSVKYWLSVLPTTDAPYQMLVFKQHERLFVDLEMANVVSRCTAKMHTCMHIVSAFCEGGWL